MEIPRQISFSIGLILRATFLESSLRSEPYIGCIDATYDIIVCIGMHARACTNGFVAHTYSGDFGLNINGINLSETTIIAVSAARFNMPVVMISGDDVLQQEIQQQLLSAEYAVVKISKSFDVCDTLPACRAHEHSFSAARFSLDDPQFDVIFVQRILPTWSSRCDQDEV